MHSLMIKGYQWKLEMLTLYPLIGCPWFIKAVFSCDIPCLYYPQAKKKSWQFQTANDRTFPWKCQLSAWLHFSQLQMGLVWLIKSIHIKQFLLKAMLAVDLTESENLLWAELSGWIKLLPNLFWEWRYGRYRSILQIAGSGLADSVLMVISFLPPPKIL